jgi:putative hydrolase of the HAD superfamily
VPRLRFPQHPPVRSRRAGVHRPSHRQGALAGSPALAQQTPVWLFDLDNTLHDTSHKIFREINIGMTTAVMESLNLDEAAASELRTRYYRRYGATLLGLVRHHNIDPHVFLQRSHAFEVAPLVKAERGLRDKLNRLPGRKVLVTNAPLHYARAVLKHLGILRCFDHLWGIEQMQFLGRFRPKPSVALMRYILAHEGVHPRRAVLVEDTVENLRSARKAGLRTVHVFHPGSSFGRFKNGRPDFVDLRVNCVGDLLLRKRPLRSV